MSKEAKPQFSKTLRETLKNSADALTKKEIVDRLEWDNGGASLSVQEKLSKSLREQLRLGYIAAEVDTLGVTRYKVTGVEPPPKQFYPPKKPREECAKPGPKRRAQQQTKEAALKRIAKKEEKEAEEMSCETRAQSDINKLKQDLGVAKIPFNYQEAYTRGYNDAMFHSHRDAYNAGRQSVLKGLLKLLNIKGEVLL